MGEYAFLPQISPDHPARILLGNVNPAPPPARIILSYRLISGSADADLWFSARKCVAEATDVPVRWRTSSALIPPRPPLNEGLVPHYAALNHRSRREPDHD